MSALALGGIAVVAPPASSADPDVFLPTDWTELIDAFDDAGASGTPATVVLQDTLPDALPGVNLTVPSGADITLDLNGHSLTITDPGTGRAGLEVLDRGTFTLDDTDPGASNELTVWGGGQAAGLGGAGLSAAGTTGTINVAGGRVDATGGSQAAGIGGGLRERGIVHITGGEIVATGDRGAGIGGGYDAWNSTVTVDDGDIEAAGLAGGAGIGSGLGGQNAVVTIHDGTVVADGAGGGAGIGGGVDGGGGTITITGGHVTASAVAITANSRAAGIGGGARAEGETTTISGGTVVADGGMDAAGIGGGGGASGHGGTITISGGDVTATADAAGLATLSTGGGAGIGAAQLGTATISISGGTVRAYGSPAGAGIGGGRYTNGATVTIEDGAVTATGGTSGSGIGGGSNGGIVTISGGAVTATGGTGAADLGGGPASISSATAAGVTATISGTGSLTTTGPRAIGTGEGATGPWGSLTNSGTITIADTSTLTVPDTITVTNSGTILNNGAIDGTGQIANTGTILGTGSVANDGQGGAGTNVTTNSYLLSFDLNGKAGTTPPDQRVLAATIDDAGKALLHPTATDASTVSSWHTAASGGTEITDTTDLATALSGAGPKHPTLYARYGQQIAFDTTPPPGRTVGSESYDADATGGASGQSVTFSTGAGTTNHACTVSPEGVVTFDHVGACEIAADQAAGGVYDPAPRVTQTIPVGTASQTISFTTTAPASRVVGGKSYDADATGGASGQPVTFSTGAGTTNDACTVTTAGVVSFEEVGTCVIAADQAGNADYDPAPRVTQTIAVGAAGSFVSVTIDHATSVYGQPVTATATTSAAGTVEFFLDGARIGGQGLIRPLPTTLEPGSHQVRVVFTPMSSNLATSTNQTTLVVTQAATTLDLSVTAGQLSATVTPVAPGAGAPTGAVTFTVAGEPVGTADLDEDGAAVLDLALPAGEAQQVAAAYGGDDRFTGSSDSVARDHPAITAEVTGKRGKRGWYTGPVTIAFTCTETTAPLVEPCPDPVTLTRDVAARSVTRTITATDGGTATVVAGPVGIDTTGPKAKIKRTDAGKPRCIASDRVSGLTAKGCQLTRTLVRKTRQAKVFRYTATAVDRAGHTTTKIRTIRIRRP